MSANAFELVKTALEAYPHVPLTESEHELTVPAADENGFDVTLLEDGDECTVFFCLWHEHFGANQAEEAAACFLAGLSEEVRVKARTRGGEVCAATVERCIDGTWHNGPRVATLGLAKF